jgi:hypothetical protein
MPWLIGWLGVIPLAIISGTVREPTATCIAPTYVRLCRSKTMFKTLILPLDGPPQSNVALPFARLLAQASHGRLVLVRVLDSAVLSPDARVEQQRLATEQLKRIAIGSTRC